MTMNPLPPQAYTKDTLTKAYLWLLNQNDSIKELATTPDVLVTLFLKAQRNGDDSLDTPSIQNFKNELKSLAGMMGELERPPSAGSPARPTSAAHHANGAVNGSGSAFNGATASGISGGAYRSTSTMPPFSSASGPTSSTANTSGASMPTSQNSSVAKTQTSNSNGSVGGSSASPSANSGISGSSSSPYNGTFSSNLAGTSSTANGNGSGSFTNNSAGAQFAGHASNSSAASGPYHPDFSANGHSNTYSSQAGSSLPIEIIAQLDAKSRAMVAEVREELNLGSDVEVLRLLISLGYKKARNLYS